MALTAAQLLEAGALTVQHINNAVPDLFARANALYKFLVDRKNYVSGGINIQMPIAGVAEIGSQGFITGTAADNLNLNQNQVATFGTLNWKFFYLAVTFDLKEITMTEDTPHAVKALIKTKVAFARNSMVRTLSAAAHGSATTDVNQFNGMDDVFAASGTAYAGINNNDIANWLCYLPSTIAAANYTNISPVLDYLVSIANQDNTGVMNPKEDVIYKYTPDLILSDATQYNAFKVSEQLKLRFTPSDLMKAGFRAINVDGFDWVIDTNCAAKTIYVLTTDSWEFFYKYGFGKQSPLDDPMLRIPQQPVKTQVSFLAGNIGCTNRRVNAKISVS